MDFPKSEFWNYSSQIWTLPDVEAVCLDLQNDYNLNVNILLFCCWVGDRNFKLNDDDLQTLLDVIQPWQTIIEPLRDSRKMMQQNLIAMPSSLRNQTITNISEMEINAEHMAQMALEKALKYSKMSPCKSLNNIECSLSNIKLYIDAVDDVSYADKVVIQVTQLLTAIFQDEAAVQQIAELT